MVDNEKEQQRPKKDGDSVSPDRSDPGQPADPLRDHALDPPPETE